MKIWKITYHTPSGESAGFSFGRTKKEALKNVNTDNTPPDSVAESSEQIFVGYSEAGIIIALNRHASHPDNG